MTSPDLRLGRHSRGVLRRIHRAAFVLALLFVGTSASAEPLLFENLLQTGGALTGFETGNAFKQNGLTMVERVPVGESVHDWSEMVTTQIFHGSPMSLDAYFGDMRRSWSTACPGAEAFPIRDGEENGYPFAVWQFSCPLNPATRKPENTWIKGIRGNDALYAVQWAFRSEPTEADVTRAVKHLKGAVVCDSRIERSRCPEVVGATSETTPVD
jgi:hypothetical protein